MNWKTYLKKKGARIGAVVLAVVLVLALIAGALGGKAGFLTNLDGIVRAPLQKAATVTAQWLESIYGYIYKYDQLKAENDQLRVQLAEAQAQAREGQEALAENERYRELLGFTQRLSISRCASISCPSSGGRVSSVMSARCASRS